MSQHLQIEIGNLKKQLLMLSGKVEENLLVAIRTIKDLDATTAEKIIDADEEIDQIEVQIEEECLKILALHQPVAVDLRFIITAMKINGDLERIGDLTVNIAERSKYLATEPAGIMFDFQQMTSKAQHMLKVAIDALVNMDSDQALEVCKMDDEVDAINRQMYQDFKDEVIKNPQQINRLLHLLLISRYVERIADHATNIAEDVVYMVNGEIVRHRTEDYTS